MSIEGFINAPINSIHNFITATQFCRLSYFDALSVSCYLDSKYTFYRYVKVDKIYIYFFLYSNQNHLYILVNSSTSLKAIEDYLNNRNLLEDIVVAVKEVLLTIKAPLDIFCVGHSAGGSYAYYLASAIQCKCLTVGQLPLYIGGEAYSSPPSCVQYISNSDLLCLKHTPNIYVINNTPPKNTLEGVVNHSIDSYYKLINNLQDSLVKPVLTHL